MRKLLAMLLVLLSAESLAATPAVPPVEVVRAEFGLFEASADGGEVAFVPAGVVPLRVGQRYGWVIELGKAPRTLSVREEYVVPVAAELAGGAANDGLEMVFPRRNLVSLRQLTPVDGRVYGEWSVGAKEPSGHRRLEVVIEGSVAAAFEFDVR